jgi:hypothetical protein
MSLIYRRDDPRVEATSIARQRMRNEANYTARYDARPRSIDRRESDVGRDGHYHQLPVPVSRTGQSSNLPTGRTDRSVTFRRSTLESLDADPERNGHLRLTRRDDVQDERRSSSKPFASTRRSVADDAALPPSERDGYINDSDSGSSVTGAYGVRRTTVGTSLHGERDQDRRSKRRNNNYSFVGSSGYRSAVQSQQKGKPKGPGDGTSGSDGRYAVKANTGAVRRPSSVQKVGLL